MLSMLFFGELDPVKAAMLIEHISDNKAAADLCEATLQTVVEKYLQ